MIRCKFKIDSIERMLGSACKRDAAGAIVKDANGHTVYEPTEMWTVKASPVYANNDPEHENSKFWAASPSGEFIVRTVNKAAVEQLVLGGEYYLDLTPSLTSA